MTDNDRKDERTERIRQWCHAKRVQRIAQHQAIVDDMKYLLGQLDAARAANSAVHALCRSALTAYEKDPGDPATRSAADLADDVQYVLGRGQHG